jgi:hypothetical protein
MSMQRSRPGYTVRVDCQVAGDASVVIEAALEYWAYLSEAERERLTPTAQLELLLAIQGEKGRLFDGKAVRVEVSGDESLHRFLDGRTKVPVKLLVAPARRLPRPAGTGMATRQQQA